MAEPSPARWRFVALSSTCVAALGLKHYYATASVEELTWVLAPTVALVEIVTGTAFHFEPGEGYLSPELALLVAPSCAGVNFLIAALCTGVLGFAGQARSARSAATVLLGAGLAAYALTVAANASRLILGSWLMSLPESLGWSAASAHRVEGVVVYFTALCLAYLAAPWMVVGGEGVIQGRRDRARSGLERP